VTLSGRQAESEMRGKSKEGVEIVIGKAFW
jgi:hypothetical protein